MPNLLFFPFRLGGLLMSKVRGALANTIFSWMSLK